ncbi:PadR family transcriptional regulator [Sandaracinobacteroides saxicola]|uniref:Helix-turn-helix transcriptional regulator n=1 Tax=Sandaracinobacteroides saxicola TaxID=2759707 RepID=A0A7G5IM20_9SPHN|nr:helix-turn-helix transcriptional regulator [Sandaracinobacteroides saxicola]QMW24412.1 helix-turn-helix transcriptional regulator [Sandaracinobacteroides saxicola]
MTAEMLKGHLDNVILATLEREPLHGYAVIETIRHRSAGSFDLPEGTIYPALHRLELAGLLASDWVEPAGGRRRRVYRLTAKGQSALAARRAHWTRFARAVDSLLGGEAPWPA